MSTPCRTQPRFTLAGPGAVGMGASLLAGVAFFNKYELPIDLSVEHAMDMDAEGDPAMRLCGDLGIA